MSKEKNIKKLAKVSGGRSLSIGVAPKEVFEKHTLFADNLKIGQLPVKK